MFFDVGFSELFLLAVLGLLILGPERLPAVARTLGGWVRRGRKMAAEFQSELEREVDMKEFRQLKHEVEQSAQPLREAADSLDEGNSILDKSLRAANRPVALGSSGQQGGEQVSEQDSSPDSGQADEQVSGQGSIEDTTESSGALEPHEPMPSTESSDYPDPASDDVTSTDAAPAKTSD